MKYSVKRNLIILLTLVIIAACHNPFFPDRKERAHPRGAIQAYYTVSFVSNGGTPAPGDQLIARGGRVAKLPIMVRDNYGFGGWFSDRRLTRPWNFDTDTVNSNITLYAKWDRPFITVIFEENNGNPPLVHSTIRVLSGTKIPEPATLTRSVQEFYRGFAGWWTNDGTGGVWDQRWDFAADIAGRDKGTAGMDTIYLYARWDDIAYTITFNAYGGVPEPRDQILAVNTKIKEPLAMHREGYGFGGWFLDGDISTGTVFNRPWNFNDIPTRNLTLYARWVTEYFIVRFDINGGDPPVPDNEEIEKGAKIVRPEGVPTRAGHGFGGWYDRSTGREWNFDNDTVNADTTLYARWDINSYTVQFNSAGTTTDLPDPQLIAHGSKAIEPRAVDRGNNLYSVLERTDQNLHFAGWYTEQDHPNGREWDFDTDTVRADMTLYARWVPVFPGMVWVRAGSFMMGDNTITGSKPAHRVIISNGFYMTTHLIRQSDNVSQIRGYSQLMGTNPSNHHDFPNPDVLPVERVSWFDAIEYANKLSLDRSLDPVYRVNGNTDPASWGFPAQLTSYTPTSMTGREDLFNTWASTSVITIIDNASGFRLPTEAEWEYAARGGRDAPENFTYSGGNVADEVAWHSGNSVPRTTNPVGTKTANTLGIYDMSGNLMEWCWDWFSSTYYSNSPLSDPRGPASGTERVRRGGSWNNAITNIRPPVRASNPPATINGGWVNGIRLVRGNEIPRRY